MTATAAPADIPEFARRYPNLADAQLGAHAVEASDEFFGAKARLLKPEPPVFEAGRYDAHGKWMDGWETRRRREPGHDHCVVRLAARGVLHGVDIDTSHFTGNYPPAASLEACLSDHESAADGAWVQIVPHVALGPSAHHFVAVDHPHPVSHLRLHIWPDGGVARLRAYGSVAFDWSAVDRDELLDLGALLHGGRAVACNDAHFGVPVNMLKPGRAPNMGDGWETRRRREPGFDWCVLALGHPGEIRRIEIDTNHFKGNFPARCSINAGLLPPGLPDDAAVAQAMHWPVLLPEQAMAADSNHVFDSAIAALGSVSHVRLNLHPDGGVSRLRLFGRAAG
ncbi:MAG: allantoicase [Alphaproteobacteria bacterium]